jgi:hypothetical protein
VRKLVVIVTLLASPAWAGSKIPAIFHGQWCTSAGVHIRGKCSPDDDGAFTIRANSIREWEATCKVKKVTQRGPSSIQIQLTCTGEGETRSESRKMRIGRGGTLILGE